MKSGKLLIAGIGLLIAGAAGADTFYLHADMNTVEGNKDPETKAIWFNDPTGGSDMDALGASFAGNDFDVNGYALRAPNNHWSATSFDGTIVVGASGANTMELLALDWTVAGMNINNSALMRVRKADPVNLSVGSMVLGPSALLETRVNNASDNELHLSIADFSGSGTLSFGKYSLSVDGLWSLAITDVTPTFTGTVNLQQGELAFSNSFSLVSASLTINASDNSVVLANDVTFGSMEFEGSSLAAGTYKAAELNTEFGTTRFSGSESLTVIPEPGTLGLLGISAAGLLLARRHFSI